MTPVLDNPRVIHQTTRVYSVVFAQVWHNWNYSPVQFGKGLMIYSLDDLSLKSELAVERMLWKGIDFDEDHADKTSKI